jgi:Fe2+ transport system protein FeoA
MKYFPRFLSSGGKQVSLHAVEIEVEESSLARVEPGSSVIVSGFSKALGEGKRAHLIAYGVVPGRRVKVIRHSPVTILQVEHTELALDGDLAKQILVEGSV